jgi:hypothetical protein
MSSNDRAGPKGLKRLSLTPGARAPPSPHAPNSTGVTTEFSLPSPLAHNRRYAPKRASSISYYNSAHKVSSPTSSSSDSFVRSPLPPTIHESTTALLDAKDGLRRAASLPKRRHTALSLGNAIETSSDVVIPAQTLTPPPQTLAEKYSSASVLLQLSLVDYLCVHNLSRHSDLLSFIAKRESKCMELREQLAQQETELASLKRKWERIVSRAANNIPGSSSDASPSPGVRSKPLPATSGTEAVSEVVGVIRDGVTGLGRMLAMGGLGAPLAPSSQPASSAPIHTPVRSATRSPSVQPAVFESSSRTSSVSSITVTSPPGSTASTGRTSLSSVTSLASEDADQDETRSDALLSDGGHSPTIVVQSNWLNDGERSLNISHTSSPAALEVQLDEPSVPSLKSRDRSRQTLDLGPSTPSPRGSFNLADRLAENKALARLTSPPPSSPSSSWVPTSLNKRLEGLQKSEAYAFTLISRPAL